MPFPLGTIFITRGASEALNHSDVLAVLGRHARGDWGDVCEDDKQANDGALNDGERLETNIGDAVRAANAQRAPYALLFAGEFSV